MNPYQPPQAGQGPYFQPTVPEHLYRIARDQRMINLIVLAYIAVSAGASMLPDLLPIRALVGVVALGVLIAGVVYAVRMASALHGTAIAVVSAILLLVPCVGLLALLVLNNQATTRLRQAGLRVGLLGADLSQFGPR